jgi:hypothetical protein
MHIDSTTNSNPTQNLSRLRGSPGAGASGQMQAVMRRPDGEGSEVSSPAKLLSKLDQLSHSDPVKLKSLMKDMSAKVKEAADKATDPDMKAALTSMSQTFAEVAKTGDVSSLMKQAEGPTYGRSGHMEAGSARVMRAPPPSGATRADMEKTLQSLMKDLTTALEETAKS